MNFSFLVIEDWLNDGKKADSVISVQTIPWSDKSLQSTLDITNFDIANFT